MGNNCELECGGERRHHLPNSAQVGHDAHKLTCVLCILGRRKVNLRLRWLAELGHGLNLRDYGREGGDDRKTLSGRVVSYEGFPLS